jgi:hypothetical protein
MKVEWQKIYESSFRHRVDIVKAFLYDQDILAVVINKKDSSYKFGTFQLMVDRNDVIRAMTLIDKNIRFE